MLEHDPDVGLGCRCVQVVAAEQLLLDCQYLALQLQCSSVLSLRVINNRNVLLSLGRVQVFRAMDSEIDIEGAIIVLHGLSELGLLIADLANTAHMHTHVHLIALWHGH